MDMYHQVVVQTSAAVSTIPPVVIGRIVVNMIRQSMYPSIK